MMKCLKYIPLLIILFSSSSCKDESTYTVEVNNKSKNKLEAVKIFWGTNHKSLGYGHIYPNTGKVVGVVLKPEGKTILSYSLGDEKIKKELDIMSKIPKNQSGEIIIYIHSNKDIKIKFKKE